MRPVVRIVRLVWRQPKDIPVRIHPEPENRSVCVTEVTDNLVHLENAAIVEPGGPQRRDIRLGETGGIPRQFLGVAAHLEFRAVERLLRLARFERGADPEMMEPGLEVATRLVLDLCGGEPSESRVVGYQGYEPRSITFPVSEVKRLTGLDVSSAESKDILQRLGFASTGEGDVLEVSVPSWRPDIDGKADLVACPPGWGCEVAIEGHLTEYGLKDHINEIKASYSASMADAVAAHDSGEPILFYTWTPNWTVNELKLGEDVVWIQVPEEATEENAAAGIASCVADPCVMGFEANDIVPVANSKFLEENPAVAAVLKTASIPLEDIFAQNSAMNDGADSPEDIKKQASDWIEKNREMVDGWLEEARKAVD